MLKIYTSSASGRISSIQAVRWLKEHQIPYVEIQLNKHPLTKKEFMTLLPYAQEGLDTFLTRTAQEEQQLKEMSLHGAIEYLIEHPRKVKKPILFDGKKLNVGFHENKIHCFIPREWRQEQRNWLNNQIEAQNEKEEDIQTDEQHRDKVMSNR